MFEKKSTRDIVGGGQQPREPRQPKVKSIKIEKNAKKAKKKHSEAPSIFRNHVFLGAVCIAIALFVAFGLTPIANMLTSEDVTAVRVKTDITKGTILTEMELETVKINARNLGDFIVTDPASVLGKYAAIDMLGGDILTDQKVSDTIQYDDPYLAAVPENKMAISVAMQSAAESLSGKLRAGDVVRLYAYMNDSLDTAAYNALSLPELQYIEVLAVTNGNMRDLDTKNEGIADAETADKEISTLTLAVNTQQAAALAGLNNCAQLHTALVTRGDEEKKQAALATQDAYFQTSGQSASLTAAGE